MVEREIEDDSAIGSTPRQIEGRGRLNSAGQWIELHDSGGLSSVGAGEGGRLINRGEFPGLTGNLEGVIGMKIDRSRG